MTDVDREYPEHVKMMKISDESQAIGQFIDWLEDEEDLYLMRRDEFGDYAYRTEGIEQLLAKYFGIDLSKIEAEKRDMLQSMRALFD